ncbi:MAG: DUF5103 domain-containing protein [Bacteroidota bacterium]
MIEKNKNGAIQKGWKMFSVFPVILVLSFSAFLNLYGASPNETACYDPMIKTIRVFQEGSEMSPPIYFLNSAERLIISFDDLGEDLRRFKFTIVHCNAEWKTSSEITAFDYIDGFNEGNIDQYTYSYNTTIRYIHYEAFFPTENMRPKISGNYLLKVYDEEPSKVVFTFRFMVVEQTSVSTVGRVEQASRIDEKITHQQLDFIVKLNGFKVYDVGREIKVIILQNGRWDNMLTVTKPRFTRGDELDYRFDENISFRGGNQYRNFDIKSLIYQTERIARILYDTANQVFLLPDSPRTYKEYVTEKDINGEYFIKNDEHAENSNTEADYAWVHFFLPFPAVLTTGSFHVLGELTMWQLNDASKMVFNYERRGYELKLLLKQGYYNYLYVLKEPVKQVADESFIEGSHWETENDYSIFVYFHETGAQYDRLIAVNFLNSINR